uniref:Uncharacterized protein n=1 Tax=Aegilops tauschii subsp. strangulata TaxID=200361 RepID=A0A452ZIK4_AEGTS
SVAKQLFSHILEVIKDAPSFQLEYSPILRQLLTVKEYRYQMKPRTYSSELPYQRSPCFHITMPFCSVLNKILYLR